MSEESDLHQGFSTLNVNAPSFVPNFGSFGAVDDPDSPDSERSANQSETTPDTVPPPEPAAENNGISGK